MAAASVNVRWVPALSVARALGIWEPHESYAALALIQWRAKGWLGRLQSVQALQVEPTESLNAMDPVGVQWLLLSTFQSLLCLAAY